MDSYYIRIRGRVSGPIDRDALTQLVRRGKLTRFDQISTDQVDWQAAGEFSELFAPRQVAASVASGTNNDASSTAYDVETTKQVSVGSLYFYAQNGVAVGPVAMGVLQSLATNGTLGSDDPVWADGSEVASPARQVPALATIFSGTSPSHTRTSRRRSPGEMPSKDLLAKAQQSALAKYLAIASVLMLLALSPLLITKGVAIWWWDVPDAGWLKVTTGYYLLATLAALIIAPITAGLARPLTMVILSGVALLCWAVSGLSAADGAGWYGFTTFLAGWLLPICVSLLIAVCRFRSFDESIGSQGDGRILQIVLGAIASLAAFVVLVTALAEMKGVGDGPTAGVIVVVMFLLCLLTGLAIGVLAIIAGSNSKFVYGVNLAAVICGVAYFCLLAAAIGVVAVAVANQFSQLPFDELAGQQLKEAGSAIAWLVARFAVLFIFTIAWLSSGVSELLTWRFVQRVRG